MNRVAFELFGIPIMWYGIIIGAGAMIALWLALKLEKKDGLPDGVVLDWFVWGLAFGILGARTYYVIFEWEHYKGDFWKMINIRGGGLAIHGAILAGLVVTLIFCRRKKIDFWKFSDVIAPALVLAQGIGRWGNYMNGEAHGGPTDLPWGIMVDGVKVHPTFFYEFVADLMICFFLLYYRNRKKNDGEVFLLYAILYSICRFFIEGFRTDSLYLGNIRMAQFISAVAIVVCAAVFFIRRKKIRSV